MISVQELQHITQSLTLLYVEDDLAIQKSMQKYLKKFFASVSVAEDGMHALEFYEKGKYDIIITDLSMPKMNGIDMIKKIKAIDDSQAIIITTAHGESNFLLSAIKAHVDGYLIKPFDYNELNFELFKTAQKIETLKKNEEYQNHLQKMLEEKTREMSENYKKTIYSMVELIEKRDTYTAGHSKRVANYCDLIAKAMGYSQEECTFLHQAAMLHDIGKIETPDAVLLNPKPLNDIEYKLIQEHVTVSYQLLNTIPMFQPLAKIVYQHHERYDGTGYPNKLHADEITPLARIMIVADAFDAMTTNRIYKTHKQTSEAIEELKRLSKKQFHPEVVKHAIIALKDVVIDTEINQLPKTKLEEERFAYFYKDTLTQVYNQNYLDVVLMRNRYKPLFTKMLIFSIHNFSQYNKEKGWEAGDQLLKEFAEILSIHLEEELIFRVFGDDFVAITKRELYLDGLQSVLDDLMKNIIINYEIMKIDLQARKIETLSDIEMIYTLQKAAKETTTAL